MKPLSDAQELAQRFNEDESVWRPFQAKRLGRDSASLFLDELLDEIDWREAEQEDHVAECVGKPPTPRSNKGAIGAWFLPPTAFRVLPLVLE